MSLNPYLFFDGNCREVFEFYREVFEFYREVFGGEFLIVQTFRDGPADLNVPEPEKDRIMHICLPIGSGMLMGSDSTSVFGSHPVQGTNFSISVVGESREHCDGLFAGLAEGGAVKMPMAETFWGSYFGNLTDRFGINWMIDYELPRG